MPANTNARLLSHDPDSGITEYFYSNADGTEYTIETTQNVSNLIELNKASQNTVTGRYGEWDQVAMYPMVIWHQLKKEGILDDPKAYKAWLNNPDNSAWRTRLGKV